MDNTAYQQLYRSDKSLYTPSSPLVIVAFALLRSNRTGQAIAQVKFRNISETTIHGVYAAVECWDANGAPLKGLHEVLYNDLYAEEGEAFGQNFAVHLPDNATRKIAVTVHKVQYEYDLWEAPARAVWEANALPEF